MATGYESLLDLAYGPSGSVSAGKRAAAIQQNTAKADSAMITGSPAPEPLSLLDQVYGKLPDPAAALQAPTAVAQPRPQTIQPSIDPQQTAAAQPQDDGFINRLAKEPKYLGAAIERGWNTLKSAVNGQKLSEYGDLIDSFNKAYTPEQVAADPELQKEKLLREGKFAELAQENGNIQKENDAILNSDRTRPETKLMFGAGKEKRGWVDSAADIGKAIIMDPGAAVDLAMSSGPSSLASAAAAALAYFGTRNAKVAASAGGFGSGYIEFGNEYADNRSEGMSHDEAWKAAAIKASIVGVFDGISMGTAGKTLNVVVEALKQGATKTALKAVGKETGRQALLGASGEALGSAAAGKEIDPTSVLLEAIGETVSAPIEAVSTRGRINKSLDALQPLTADEKNRAFADALQKDVDSLGFTAKGVDEDARAQLDPNRDTAIDPRLTAMPPLANPTTGLNEVNDPNTQKIDPTLDLNALEQQTTAVGVPEPTFSEDQQQGVAQQVSPPKIDQGNPVVQQDRIKPAGEIDSNELMDQLSEVDRQAADTNQQLSTPVVPETLQVAVRGMATELGLPEGETLQVKEVTDDKRLNTLGKALSSAFGVNVHWVDFGESGMMTSAGQNMGGFNGYRQGDTILVDPKNVNLMDTTWHELTHTLETKYPELYAQLRDTILSTVDPAMKTALYDALNKRRVAEVGKPMTASQLESELVAVTVGGQASNPEYLGQLFDSFKDKTLAQQFKNILSEILVKLSKALQGPAYVKERQKINQTRDAITKAFVAYQQREAAKGKPATATNATGATAVMPEALAVKVASSKLSSNLTNRDQTNASEKREIQQGDQQQLGGVDQSVQSPQQDQQQPASQPASTAETSTRQAKPVGQFSRIAPPVADKDGIVRVNGREYPERTESYTPDGTKAYLKRAVDIGPRPKSLPLEPEKFFKYNYLTRMVNVSDIDSSKTVTENIQGTENAPKRFMAAYDGVVERRDAIAIKNMGNGRFKVIDGNGTLNAFKGYGWQQIPANVFKDEASFKEFEEKQTSAPRYAAYMLSNANRRILQNNFPPSHERLILDHITANPNDPARPTKVEVVGLSDHDGIQAFVVIVDGKRHRDDKDSNGEPQPYHITLSVTKSASSGDAGKMINKYGYVDITPFELKLPYGADYKQVNRKQDVLDRLTDSDQNQPVANNELIKYPDILKAVIATQEFLSKAPAIKKSYDAFGEKFAKETGTKYIDGPLKKFPKAFAKIWYEYEGNPLRLKDAVRSTIAVEFPDQVQGAIDAVLATYSGSALKHNRWNPDPAIAKVLPSGYRDVMFNLSFGGIQVELQMNLPEMIAAKDIGHPLYDKVVKLNQEMAKSSTSNERAEVLREQIADLDAQQAVIYGDAFKKIQERVASREATNLRNSASEITSPSSSAVRRLYGQGGSSRTVGEKFQQRQSYPEIVTGMPLATSRNIVPSGNESGNRTIEASPVAILDSNIPQQEGLGQASRKLNVGEEAGQQQLGFEGFGVQAYKGKVDNFSYAVDSKGRINFSEQVERVRALASGVAKPSNVEEDNITYKASDAAGVMDALRNAPTVDKEISTDIKRQLRLSDQELASTSLGWQTGESKSRAFMPPIQGALPETVAYLEQRRRESGLRLLDVTKEDDQDVIARLISAEVMAAIRSSGNAVEWYDETIARTLAMASVKYPELANDSIAQMAFRLAMAITSQGLNVESNLKFTMTQYEQFRKDGRFPIAGQGDAESQMEGNFKLVNDLLDQMGPVKLRQFLVTKFTVGELNKAGIPAEGELTDEVVLGSSVLGPKIGFGFYSNLNGNFEPVTMDMWFMRTIGRLTGSLRLFDANNFASQLVRFRDSLDADGTNGVYANRFEAELVDRARTNADSATELARMVKKAHERDFKENRVAFNAGERIKTELVYAAERIINSVDKPKDAPANGSERRFLREVMRKVVDEIERVHGHRVPPAALQALIWYPEQELYKSLGVKLAVTSQDYAGATEKILKEEGYDGNKLRSAAELRSRNLQQEDGRSRYETNSEESKRPDGFQGEGFSPREKGRFLLSRIIRRYRTNDAAKPNTYERKSGSDGKSLRVLGVQAEAQFAPRTTFKNALEVINKPAPKMFELGPKGAELFRNSIESSKSETPFGASVYTYSKSDYEGMRLFLSADGKAGFALKGDDIVSVFSGVEQKGSASAMLQLAIDEGGRRLDAFNTILPSLYADNGFKAVARAAWNEQEKPDNWDKSLFNDFNNGEPDVVFMAYDPANASEIGGATIEDYGQGSVEQERSLSEVRQFSRADVVLAANGDPRAPQLFGISQTPAVLTAVGAPRQLLVMDPKNVAKVVNPSLVGKNTEEAVRKNAAGQWVTVQPRIPLTVDELRLVPAMIADPVAVFNSAGDRVSRRQGYKVLIDLVKDGFPVVAIIHPDVRFGPDAASELVSVYPANEQTTLNELNSDLKKDGQLLYFNKGKALALNQQIGNRLSSVLKASGAAKVPGQVPNRTFTPLPPSNFARALGQGGIGNRFTLPDRTFAEQTSNLLANEMSRVTAVQNAVVAQGGTVTDKTRIEDVVHRMYGKAGNRMDTFRKTFVQPLIERAAKANVNLDDVAMYLYANHALERNDYIRSINPAFPDAGSGMSDADAKQVLKDMRSKGAAFLKLKNVADQLQSVGRMTQQALLDGGLVDQAHLYLWNQRYKNYVPLKGFEQIDEIGQTKNGRFDPRNPFFKRAMGRGSRAGQIVENILLDHEEAIVAAEKNKVRQAFLKFALDNKDDALWHVNPVASQARFDKNTSLVSYATVMDEGKDTIGVRYNGKPYSIKVTDAAMLDDLLMAPMMPTQPAVRWMFNKWATVNRTLAKLWTALSPAFVLTNAQRDLEFAIAKSAVEAGGKQTVDVVKDFIPAAYAIMRAERNNSWGANSELKKYYDMYKADGGKTGFMDLKTLDERQREVVSAFKNAQASGTNPLTYHRLALRYVQSAEDFIMDINGGIENAARVAAYKSAIESGRTRTEAATIAKNLTVNFNRRGKLSPFLSSFYLFFNPAVQGAVATKNLMFSKKGAALGASLAAVGYMVASMAAGALGDDGEPFWEKDANRQAKLKSLLFFGPNGEQYTIPLAYGLGFFVNLGYAMRDLEKGASPLKVAKFMRDSFFVHFSPLGSMDSFANFLLPTLFDPLVVLRDGEREDGSPLLPPNIDGTKPASERYWTNTRDTAIERFTTWVNEATGGSKAVSGFIDVSPEQVKYVTTFATGGAGSFIRDTLTSIDLMMNVGPEAAVEKNAIPILKQFYKTNTGQMDQRAFYDNAVITQQAKKELKEADNMAGEMPEGMRKRLQSGKVEAYADIEGMHRSAVKQLSDIRKRELEVIDNPDMSKAEKYQVRKGLDEERRQVEVEFNRNFYGVRKNVGSFTPWSK